jgi:hypothetical protein
MDVITDHYHINQNEGVLQAFFEGMRVQPTQTNQSFLRPMFNLTNFFGLQIGSNNSKKNKASPSTILSLSISFASINHGPINPCGYPGKGLWKLHHCCSYS